MAEDKRTDVDVLLGVLELMFIEFSNQFGSGDNGQLKVMSTGSPSYPSLIRPLTLFGVRGKGKPYEHVAGALLLHQWGEPGRTEGRYLQVLRAMPTIDEVHEISGGSGTLIKFYTNKELKDDTPEFGKEFMLHADVVLGSDGFSFINDTQYWSMINAMLSRFAYLASGFPFRIREHKGLVSAR